MSDPDIPTTREVEELATLLDHATTPGGGPAAGASPLARTVAAVHAGDLPPVPSPAFRATLKGHVMRSALSPSLAPSLNGHAPPPAPPRLAPVAARARTLPTPSRRRGLVELAALAALIAVIFGQAMGLGDNLAFWRRDPGPSPTTQQPVAAPGDVSTPGEPVTQEAADIAVERGNAARTGVYDTKGPHELPALLWRHSDPSGEPIDVLEPIVAGNTVHFSINRGGSTGVSPFSLPAGEGGFAGLLLTSKDRVNLAFGHGLVFAASILGQDRRSGEIVETPALVAYDQETNEERWRAELNLARNSSPLLVGESLVVLTADALVVLDALTGEERWRNPVNDLGTNMEAGRSPATDGDLVVVNQIGTTTGAPGSLKALDVETGELRWTLATDGEFGPPAISDGMVYAYEMGTTECCANRRLSAIDAATGEVAWQFPGAGDEASGLGATWGSPVVDATSVYAFEQAIDETATTFTARDKANGELRWQRDIGDTYGSQISVAGGILYYTLTDGGVYAVGAEDGVERWRIDTGDGTLGTPIPSDGYLVVASRSAVYAFGPAADPSTAATDVSGLPPCTSPRTLPDALPTGEPALELVPVEGNPLGAGIPSGGRVLLADVPTGEQAPDAAMVGIYATFRAMTACDRPGSELELAGYYSDDYFRRFDQTMRKPGTSNSFTDVFRVATIEIGDLGTPFTLPDGRVALLALDPLGDVGALLIFVEQDGTYLIDEVAEVGRSPEVWMRG